MSRYSSDSSDDDYKEKSSHRKRRRSGSSSSKDSYVKSSKRRTRNSRSHSRDSYRSKHSYRDQRNSNKDAGRSHRSRSRRMYRSTSRSRSWSRNSLNSCKKKLYSKSKKRYRSRSRSRSYHRKSRSHSRRRSRSKPKSYRSRSRSSSSSRKKNSPSNKNGNESSVSEDCVIMEGKQSQSRKGFEAKSIIKIDSFPENNYSTVIIPSDDPITKQEQLDDINAPSFTQKAFKSSKSTGRDEEHSVKSNFLNFESKVKIKSDSYINNLEMATSKFVEDGDPANEKRKNDTVFHDNIAFEDNELKVQKWVKKLFAIRQKFLFGCPN